MFRLYPNNVALRERGLNRYSFTLGIGKVFSVKLEEFFAELEDKSNLPQTLNLSWTIAGLFDAICPFCGNPVLLVVESESDPSSNNSKLVCATGEHVRDSLNFSRKEFDVIDNRLLFALENMGTVGKNLQLLSGATFELRHSAATEETSTLPEGFKLVAWLKYFEAEAIIKCYKTEENISVGGVAGNSNFEATYFPDNHPDALKYHANCQVARGSRGWRKWIRLEEAQAIIEANLSKKDVEFAHLKYGNGGLVRYFPPTHPDAKRFRSTTMLLRRS
jgi:hypothetical protein